MFKSKLQKAKDGWPVTYFPEHSTKFCWYKIIGKKVVLYRGNKPVFKAVFEDGREWYLNEREILLEGERLVTIQEKQLIDLGLIK
jgi:hypothetical protein